MSKGTVTITLEHYEHMKRRASIAAGVEDFMHKLTRAWKHSNKPNQFTDFNCTKEIWEEANKLMKGEDLDGEDDGEII